MKKTTPKKPPRKETASKPRKSKTSPRQPRAKKSKPEAREGAQDAKPDERQAFRIMEAVKVGAENYRKPIYKREEIAPIAAQLLNGNDIPKAVEQAIRLLAECDKQMRDAEEANQIATLASERERAKGMPSGELTPENKWNRGLPITINELAKWITGQNRPDRARQALRECFEEISKCRAKKRAHDERELGLEESQANPWTADTRTLWDNILKQHGKTEYDSPMRPDGMQAICEQVHFFLGLKWKDENVKRPLPHDKTGGSPHIYCPFPDKE